MDFRVAPSKGSHIHVSHKDLFAIDGLEECPILCTTEGSEATGYQVVPENKYLIVHVIEPHPEAPLPKDLVQQIWNDCRDLKRGYPRA